MFRAFRALLAILIVFHSVVAHAADPDQLIARAEKLYEQLEYEEALKVLVQVLETKTANETQLARAYLYMGVCFTALGSQDNAVRAFVELLKIRSDFRMPDGVSPSIRANFDQALRTQGLPVEHPGALPGDPGYVEGTGAIVLSPITPAEVSAGQPIDVRVQVVDPNNQVTQLVLYWRRDDALDYSSTRIDRTPGATQVAMTISGATTGEAEGQLLYYIEGLDTQGQSVAMAGNAQSPRQLHLLEAEGFMKPWMWWTIGGVAGAALIGATIAAILLSTGDNALPPDAAGVTVTIR